MYATVQIWRTEDNFVKSVSSLLLPLHGLKDPIQAIRLVCKHFTHRVILFGFFFPPDPLLDVSVSTVHLNLQRLQTCESWATGPPPHLP